MASSLWNLITKFENHYRKSLLSEERQLLKAKKN